MSVPFPHNGSRFRVSAELCWGFLLFPLVDFKSQHTRIVLFSSPCSCLHEGLCSPRWLYKDSSHHLWHFRFDIWIGLFSCSMLGSASSFKVYYFIELYSDSWGHSNFVVLVHFNSHSISLIIGFFLFFLIFSDTLYNFFVFYLYSNILVFYN